VIIENIKKEDGDNLNENIKKTLELISNPYEKAKLSIMHSSSSFSSFNKFFNNFLCSCSDFSLVELLLKVDSYRDIKLYEDVLKENNIKYKFLVYPVFNLRHSMHLFFNDLSSIASTNLVWAAGEDMVVKRGDWLMSILKFDKQLNKKYKDGIYGIGLPTQTDDGKPVRIGTIQIVTKKWIEALGEYCPFPNQDRWLHMISKRINRWNVINEKEFLLCYPRGRRTFSKRDKKYIFNPVVEKTVEKLLLKLK